MRLKNIAQISLFFLLFSFSTSFSQDVSQDADTGQSGGMILQIKEPLIENLTGEFTATFQATPVKDVFRIFAMQSGLNIMLSPNLKDNITANFTKVGIKDAFLAILSANNLYYLVQGNIVKIMTSREYKNELLRQYVVTKSYDASIIDIKNLVTIIKPMLSPGVGTYSIDSQSSKIMITDIKENFERLDKFFKEISSLPRMVDIETKILQIDLNDVNQTGIDWSILNLSDISSLHLLFSPASGIADELISAKASHDFANNINSDNKPITVNAIVSAISKKLKTRLISQPRVLAMNRQESTILIGSRVPYIKSISINQNTAQSTSQVEFIDVGIKMVVIPLITPENEVKLSIKAESSSYEFVAITSTENAPKVITTTVNCDTIVKDGQPIIIGGLLQKTRTTDKKGVPFLMDIPILDLIFSHKISTITTSEMVIFLTPRVLKSGENNLGSISPEAQIEAIPTNSVTNLPIVK